MNTITIGLPVLPVEVHEDGYTYIDKAANNVPAQIRIMTFNDPESETTDIVAIQIDMLNITQNAAESSEPLTEYIKDAIKSAEIYDPSDMEVEPGTEAPDLFGNGQKYVLIEVGRGIQ